MADVSSYDSSLPSGSSEIRKGDDRLRKHWWDLESALTEEHYFTDSSGSGGVHKPGSSRLSYGSEAATTGDEGRLFYDVGGNVLVAQGSSATTEVGGAFIGAKVNRVGGQQEVKASDVSFSNEVYDTSGFFPGPSGKTLTIKDPGKYLVKGQIETVTDHVSGGFYRAEIQINNTRESQSVVSGAFGVDFDEIETSFMGDLASDDSIQLFVDGPTSSITLTGSYLAVSKLGLG